MTNQTHTRSRCDSCTNECDHRGVVAACIDHSEYNCADGETFEQMMTRHMRDDLKLAMKLASRTDPNFDSNGNRIR